MTHPNGAKLLLLLRDGKADDLEALRQHFGIPAGASFYVTSVLDDLRQAGLITTDPANSDWSKARIRVTPQLGLAQHALGLSLHQIASASADSVSVTPYFGQPLGLDEPLDLFVLMPFAKELLPVYQDHIVKVASNLGLIVKRGDDFFTAHHIMADVWRGIWGARAIIADCTGRNPNVFYEIGVAHTIGKPVILITQRRKDVPFDLQAIRYLEYELTPRGMADFEQRLEATLKTVLSRVPPESPYSLRGDPNKP